MSDKSSNSSCFICGDVFSCDRDISNVYEKGLLSLKSASVERGDGLFANVQNHVRTHRHCRNHYVS